MTLRYTIESLGLCDYVVDFEFHRELDGQLVYDAAFSVIQVVNYSRPYKRIYPQPGTYFDDDILKWLSNGGEAILYEAADREFK